MTHVLRFRPAMAALPVLLLFACDGADTSGLDGALRRDGGRSTDAGAALVPSDAAQTDAAPSDTSTPAEDAGVVEDAGVTGPGLSTGDHPRMYIDGDEIAAVLERVRASEEPWLSAYRRAIEDANTALVMSPRSVRDRGSSTSGDFDTWRDGSDRPDYNAAIAMSRAIRDLGIGYAFSGEARYADRAIELIDHWALAPDTRMFPRWTVAQSHIEISITMPGIFYGADLIWEYPGWVSADRDAFQMWAADFAADVRSKRSTDTVTNNFGDWRLVMIASAAVIAEDSTLLQYAFDFYRVLVPNQINTRGEMGWEWGRDTGLSYSTFALSAIAQVAEIARHYDVDLYHFADERGHGRVELAFDFLAPYVTNPSTWGMTSATRGRRQDRPYVGDNVAAFELGYLIWGKPEYLAALERWGRPAYDIRTGGPFTLTHARGAFTP